MKKVLLLLYVGLCFGSLQAQAPVATLGAGITAVTGQKGVIDVQLLSEIISQKQEELKKEFLQKRSLRLMGGRSFAMKNFIYSNFATLLTIDEKNAIEKELLEQVSIFALHVGVAETIMQLSLRPKEFGPNSPEMQNALVEYMNLQYGLDESQARTVLVTFRDNVQAHNFMLLFSIDKLLVKSMGTTSNAVKNYPKESFSSIFLDCVFEVCRENKTLQELGFVQIHPSLRTTYESENQFLTHHQSMSSMKTVVAQTVDVLVNYHPLFHDFINEPDLTINEIKNATSTAILSSSDMAVLIDEVEGFTADISRNLADFRETDYFNQTTFDKSMTAIQHGIDEFKIRINSNLNDVTISDYLFMKKVVDPFIGELLAAGAMTNDQIATVNRLKQAIYGKLVEHVVADIRSKDAIKAIHHIAISDYSHLLRIITSLSELDRVESYEHIFNTLVQLGLNATENSEVKLVRDLTHFIDVYTLINVREKNITVEVEPLLLAVMKKYENRASRPVQPYFGIGLNQTTKVTYRNNVAPLFAKDSSLLKSMGYAGEKVGVKVKLLNNERLQAMERDELKGPARWFRSNNAHTNSSPLITDIYTYAYGTGLLYQVADLTTAGNFNQSMVGAGVGVAFFNALDLGIWIASPLTSGSSFSQNIQDRQFVGFSFDVKLGEYLNAVREKRKRERLVTQ